jgi:hypothetical protein
LTRLRPKGWNAEADREETGAVAGLDTEQPVQIIIIYNAITGSESLWVGFTIICRQKYFIYRHSHGIILPIDYIFLVAA